MDEGRSVGRGGGVASHNSSRVTLAPRGASQQDTGFGVLFQVYNFMVGL